MIISKEPKDPLLDKSPEQDISNDDNSSITPIVDDEVDHTVTEEGNAILYND